MQELINEVKGLIPCELERANKKFPLFQSAHEGYAVMLEEVEEVESELNEVKYAMKMIWNSIKDDGCDLNRVESMKKYATNLAAESVQVTAMAQKFIESSKTWK